MDDQGLIHSDQPPAEHGGSPEQGPQDHAPQENEAAPTPEHDPSTPQEHDPAPQDRDPANPHGEQEPATPPDRDPAPQHDRDPASTGEHDPVTPQDREPTTRDPQDHESGPGPDRDPTSRDPQEHDPTSRDPQENEPSTRDPQENEPSTRDPQENDPASREPQEHEPTTRDSPENEPTSREPQDHEPSTRDPQETEPTSREPQDHEAGPHNEDAPSTSERTPTADDNGTTLSDQGPSNDGPSSPSDRNSSPSERAPSADPSPTTDHAPTERTPSSERDRPGSGPGGNDRGAAPRPERDAASRPHENESEPRPAHDEPHTPADDVPRNLPEHLHDIWRNSEETPAGRSLYGPNDEAMRNFARQVTAEPDRYVIDAHGTADGVTIDGQKISAKDLAELIYSDPNWDGKDVLLLSCHTANGDYASQLAHHLGVRVTAPDTFAWSDHNGNVYATGAHRDVNLKVVPDEPMNGSWKTHYPDGSSDPAGKGYAPSSHEIRHPSEEPPSDNARARGDDPPDGDGPDHDPNTLHRGEDGLLHRAGDPDGFFRTEDGRLHHEKDPDPEHTHRTEDKYQLKDSKKGTFVEDPLKERPYDFDKKLGDKETYEPEHQSEKARAELEDLAGKRNDIDVERQGVRDRLKPVLDELGIKKHEDVNSEKKIEAQKEKAIERLGSDPKVLQKLEEMEKLAKDHNRLGQELAEHSEKLGMAGGKDYLVHKLERTLLTPTTEGKGKPDTLDIVGYSMDEHSATITAIEAKGVGSSLMGRTIEDFKKAAQGSPEYLDFVLSLDPDLHKALNNLSAEKKQQLQDHLNAGTLKLEYVWVHASKSGVVKFADFDLTRDDKPFDFRRVSGLEPRG